MRYYLNIGSNLGNRRDNICRAVVMLAHGAAHVAMSGFIESAPWGFDSGRRFLNMGMSMDCDDDPHLLLNRLHEVERLVGSGPHRDAQGHYIDRLVDIDIMAIDDLVINDPDLQVPHAHLPERDFFLQPMMQLAPHWHHPVTGLTASQMLERFI